MDLEGSLSLGREFEFILRACASHGRGLSGKLLWGGGERDFINFVSKKIS